jgi:hypothetical protein
MILAFIYTDALTEDDESDLATMFHNLLAAADHYASDRLKVHKSYWMMWLLIQFWQPSPVIKYIAAQN